jgi:hypothetical protein
MNVERLHAVARNLRDEIDALSVLENLSALLTGLEGQVNNPTDPGPQRQLSEARVALENLSTAPSNDWSSADKQVMLDIGVANVFGRELLVRVEDVLARNEITPTVAVDELTPVRDRLQSVHEQLRGLLEALEFFEIGSDEPVGDAEIIVTIPRAAVDEELSELGQEFKDLARILAPFQELVTGSRSGFPVESISSSMFGVELLALPALAYGIAKAINEILTVYKNVLDIRESRQRLKDSGVPDEALAPIEQYANQAVEERNAELAEELVAELPSAPNIDEHRKNELTVEIRFSLNAIANRIDQDYSFDVRAPEPEPEAAESEEGGEAGLLDADETARRNFQRQIRDLAPRLRAGRTPSASILELPEGNTDATP